MRTSRDAQQSHAVGRDKVLDQLERILAHPLFQKSERLSTLLRYTVEITLAGESQSLKEFVIGVEAFQRGPSFDPQTDNIVRVNANRLRSKLAEYYQRSGQLDSVVIGLPRGCYVPCFSTRRAVKHDVSSGDAAERSKVIAPMQPLVLQPSIAVLPFVNMSAEQGGEYFSDGLAEEIITALSQLSGLKVIARTSVFSFKGRHEDIRRIAATLGVDHVLEGSVRQTSNRLRVTVQLIAAADGTHLWSERYDREMSDIFELQDDIAEAIANTLRVKFFGRRRPTENIEAYQCYLKGIYYYQSLTLEGTAKAKEYFHQALTHDQDYAQAYVSLAVCALNLAALPHKLGQPELQLVTAAVEKALTLSVVLPELYCVRGIVAAHLEYDWKAAEQEFQIAMATEPVPISVRSSYALWFLIPRRRFDDAFEQFRAALETDPLSIVLHFASRTRSTSQAISMRHSSMLRLPWRFILTSG